MERMYSNWQQTDRERTLTREQELKGIYDDVGGYRFEAAVTRAIREYEGRFFPTVGEFMKFIPAKTGAAESTCPMCKDSFGFIIYTAPNPYDSKLTHTVATRCPHDGTHFEGRIR
jgi:hypothetical protein